MFDHAYALCFTVTSNTEDGSDVTPEQLRQAIRRWVDEADDDSLMMNCDAPYDTYELEDS